MVRFPTSQASHPVQRRESTSGHPNARRRVNAQIRSNHPGSSFDSVRHITDDFHETIIYSRIRSDRPGASYDSARRVLVPVTQAAPPAETTRPTGELRSVSTSLRFAFSAWRTSAVNGGASRATRAAEAPGRLDFLQP